MDVIWRKRNVQIYLVCIIYRAIISPTSADSLYVTFAVVFFLVESRIETSIIKLAMSRVHVSVLYSIRSYLLLPS